MSQFVYILFFIGLLTSQAFANIGIPVIGILYPFELMALVSVIFIEFIVVNYYLKKALTRGTIFVGVGCANAISTIFGIPITWLFMLLLQFIVGLGAWNIEILGRNNSW